MKKNNEDFYVSDNDIEKWKHKFGGEFQRKSNLI